jgi:hypothetical protein
MVISMYIAAHVSYLGRKTPWKTWRARNLSAFFVVDHPLSFSHKRMTYAPETGQVVYQSKNGQ